ncbi:hypothetical protein GGI25_004454 [Coemansia spiralis]|uniref:Uncharacterized protein n=2 Tax=Coemansia TaxID=4863 RepID=A0A9W8G4S5_9FUNG|nr:hypothetical protein EDC05_004151 [Coemansia umbellata]KAJ2619103.1 hypothetical protein GGI26_006090 [Coemansia sp. RSA 1358]KAJ2674161.1 hypothetical protein GGI25_004454 [Coemansia spiralis]
MRIISLSSRLQWAFRGTVLPGALATGDVDNDGCNEFVVGSVQGELAIFRGRGGCGSWRYSEDQIEPEYDCWDAVERGQIPSEALTNIGSEPGSLRRQSTYNSHIYGPTSNRGSLSVEDIIHMFEGNERVLNPFIASADTSEDDAGIGLRRASSLFDADFTDHIKWEDALDLERDGRKPWILAQRLGTITSVSVADIGNCGHNSIVVVNGEGKCYVFDYPFKRKLHPEATKRNRQRNHYRRFSLERFFKDGVVVDTQDLHNDQDAPNNKQRSESVTTAGVGAGAEGAVSSSIGREADSPVLLHHTSNNSSSSPSADAISGSINQHQAIRIKTTFSETAASDFDQADNTQKTNSNSHSTPLLHNYDIDMQQPGFVDLKPLNEAALTAQESNSGTPPAHIANTNKPSCLLGNTTSGSDSARKKASWRPIIRDFEPQQPDFSLPGSDAIAYSNVSFQPTTPLTSLEKCGGSEGAINTFAESSDSALHATHMPISPSATKPALAPYAPNGAISVATSSSSNRQRYVSDTGGADSVSMAYADIDTESDQDFGDAPSDTDDCTLLTSEEAADIEKIWGANVGKKSGDWFPFVLDTPDMTFNIPTNVEHALVADVDNDGLNELVLTATDGFVYIFRVESTVKHAIKPTLASLGVFSNIPTTFPSANMTGNGSPYLYMSAPRSPDASDLDLDESITCAKPTARNASNRSGKQPQKELDLQHLKQTANQAPGFEKAPEPAAEAATEAMAEEAVEAPETASDLSLVNQLLKSIKDVSATPSERRLSENADTDVRQFPVIEDTAVKPDTTQNLGDSSNANADDTVAHRSSTGRRMSLSNRMRESFTGIVSGWDLARKSSGSCSQTGSSSVDHSQVQTRNNSANSTNTHSRKPSIDNEVADALKIPAEVAAYPQVLSEAARKEPRSLLGSQASSVVSSANELRVQRVRNNSICIGALGVLEEMPERRSGDIERDSVAVVESPTEQEVDSKSEVALKPNGLLASNKGNVGSRVHSRNGSITRSNAPSTRAHSRHGSIASVASRPRIPSTTLQEPESSQAYELRYGGSCLTSRRASIASNISTHEGSTHGNPSSTHAAAPLEVAISAQGSFSKPSYSQPPTHTDVAQDNSSIISQVTERLAELEYKPKLKLGGNANNAIMCATPQYTRNKRGGGSYYDSVDCDGAVQLPPSRSVVDWSASSIDKIATWFLDNIPGNVSIITAPANIFGKPSSRQRNSSYSDDSSEYSCSSCDCSLCGNDSEDGSDEFNMIPYKSATTAATKARVNPIAYNMTAKIAGYSGVNLPRPLGLDSINKDRTNGGEVQRSDEGLATSGESDIDARATPSRDSGDEKLSSTGQADDMLPDSPYSESEIKYNGNLQQFLILSKPGGRFVPIDMLKQAVLPAVEPPQLPIPAFTGGNMAHMMNVDTSKVSRNTRQGISFGMSLPSDSVVDLLGTSGSKAYQLPSWQSGSMPWLQNIRSASYGSTGQLDKSLIGIQGGEVSQSQVSHHSLSELVGLSTQQSTDESILAQFPASDDLANKSMEQSESHTPYQPSSALPTSSSRKSATSAGGASSVFSAAPGSGVASLSSNIRSMRSLHRTSNEGLRSQNFNTGHGPSPIYRGSALSGSMTPVGSGYPIGYGHYDRRNLGVAGLRGYIGNGVTRQRAAGGSMTSMRIDDSNFVSGYFTPFAGGQVSARGQSAGVVQGMGYGTMPREPMMLGYSSSVSTSASISNANDRMGRPRIEGMRHNPRTYRNSPATLAVASVSPQRVQQMTRYSPSVAAWSSYKDGPTLSTIRDQEEFIESSEENKDIPRRNSAAPDVQSAAEQARDLSPFGQSGSVAFGNEATTTPYSDSAAAAVGTTGRGFWLGLEPQSARSHSSAGTGTSAHFLHITDATKGEEEIEEAPQPMEMDVATFMVGGVTAGKRLRRILHGPTGLMQSASTRSTPAESVGNRDDADSNGDSDDDETLEMEELVSLVSMDGIITCYDPVRKISHFVGLNSKDPVLGIWKVKMHEEISNPSPLEAMLQDGCLSLNSDELWKKLLDSTPAKRIYRRVGLSHRDLLHAVQYSSFIEERVILLNRLESQRRRQSRRQIRKVRSQTRMGYGAANDKKTMLNRNKRESSLPGVSRGNGLWKAGKAGINSRLRDNLTRYHRVGQAVRNLGSQIRDLATSGSTQQSAVESAAAVPVTALQNTTANLGYTSTLPSDYTTPNMSLSPTARKQSAGIRAQMQYPGNKHLPSSINRPSGEDGDVGGRVANTSSDFIQSTTGSGTGQSSSSHIPISTGMADSPSTNLLDAVQARKALNADFTTALAGWYGENKDDFRRSLRVADHLVVSTWRGTTYFVDVGTILDIARYNELFSNRWSTKLAARSEAASANAANSCADNATSTRSERDTTDIFDGQSCVIASLYGSLSEFVDISGLVSRLRVNASVIQFKFQDTVSAFLADTYAPATGGPNVPCMFYVDNKDRIWVYYHLDEIAEMDDVYGATWLKKELESQCLTPSPKARAADSKKADQTNYDKPFSIVDLAYRRISRDPWVPLPSDSWYSTVISFGETKYPYSFRDWRKQKGRADSNSGNGGKQPECADSKAESFSNRVENSRSLEASCTHSDISNGPNVLTREANANVTGSFHASYLPGPFMCPLWADINSVDLYDVGVCNLLELVTPELLAMKDIFCKDLGINPETIDEKVNLASIPGLANWVRSCLYKA